MAGSRVIRNQRDPVSDPTGSSELSSRLRIRRDLRMKSRVPPSTKETFVPHKRCRYHARLPKPLPVKKFQERRSSRHGRTLCEVSNLLIAQSNPISAIREGGPTEHPIRACRPLTNTY